ncbi:low-affinity phosphate transporter, partial [Kappamyces sp. JEL0680]
MVKFSHAIALNSNPAWREKYISYSSLKKTTYVLEKAVLGTGTIPKSFLDLERMTASPSLGPTIGSASNVPRPPSAAGHATDGEPDEDNETQPLLQALGRASSVPGAPRVMSLDEANNFFTLSLDKELEKICDFYKEMETDLLDQLYQVTVEIKKQERQEENYLHSLWASGLESSRDPATIRPSRIVDPPSGITPRNMESATSSINSNGPPRSAALDAFDNAMTDEISPETPGRILLPQPSFLPYLIWSSPSLKHSKSLFIKQLTEIFVNLSELKGYVDINQTGFGKVLKKYEKVVGAKLKESYLAKVDRNYPFLATTKEKLDEAIERLTLWYARIATDGKTQMAATDLNSHLREHIEHERRTETIGFVPTDSGVRDKMVEIQVCGCTVYLPRVIPTNVLVIFFAILALVMLSRAQLFPYQEQNNCFGILIFASILWAFEAMPLFVTSICVPVLVVSLRVMTDKETGLRLDAKATAKLIFSDMFGPVIMLLLGGFSLAAALSKHNIAKALASVILSKAGSKPHWVLLANMFVSTFASMWISNVAAPVLCFSLIQPILRNL